MMVYGYAFNIGVALLAQKLTKSRANKDRVDDFAPTTLATQGAMIPRLIGKRRVGCVFGWAGDRVAGTASVGGGGKGSRRKRQQSQPVYQESGWHLLCIGPAYALTKIWADGKIIWEGSINSTDDPSGTAVTLDTGEEFVIYWGEDDQPVSSFLSDASRVGVSSAWPNVCHVVWTRKTLGAQPRWQQIEYELEVKAEQSILTNPSGGYITGPPAGVNPAHALAELLFAPYPHGAGFDPDEWDISALNAFAEEAESLGVPCSVLASDGEELQTMVAQLMQDHGLLLRWNTRAQVDSDLLIYLPFTEADGYLADHSGNDRDMEEVGTLTNVTSSGKLGTGVEFEGTADHYLKRPTNDTALDLATGDFTISLWVKFNSGVNFNNEQNITEKLVGASTSGWSFYKSGAVPAGPPAGPADGIQWGFVTGGALTLLLRADGIISADTWYHLVVRRSGSTFTLWCNGSIVDTEVSPASLPGTSEPLRIGHRNETDGRDFPLDGTIDEYAIRSRALTATGIAHEYNSGVARPVVGGDGFGYQFVRLREPCLEEELSDGLPHYYNIPAGMIEGPLPEVRVSRGERGADRLVFSFPDKSREYRLSALSLGGGSQAAYLEHQRARKVDLPTVVDFDAAAQLAERRSQEELGPQIRYTLELSKGGKALLPGDRILVAGFSYLMRIVEVEPRPAGGARVVAVQDAYGVAAGAYPSDSSGGTAGPSSPAAADLAFAIAEVPAHLLGPPGSPPAVVVPRIRADENQQFADLWISPDGTTYSLAEREYDLQQGGTLLDAIAADTAWYLPTSATFTALGPDIAEVEDLSSDLPAWRLGRQLALIGDELFFLQKVTLVSGSTYRLDGLLRARFDTQMALHSIGAKVFIFLSDEIQYVQDPLLVPARVLRVKTQPYASTAFPLASVTAETRTLLGKGIAPMRPAALRVTAPVLGSLSFRTGQNVSFRWAHRSAQVVGTGAGMQGAGSAVGASALLDTFEIKFLTTGDVLKKTVTQATDTYTLTNADLVTDFAGEPAAFKVQVRQINGGYKSEPIEKTVTRI